MANSSLICNADRFFVPSSIMFSVMFAVPGAENWSAAYPASKRIDRLTIGIEGTSARITLTPFDRVARCSAGKVALGGSPAFGSCFRTDESTGAAASFGKGWTSSV